MIEIYQKDNLDLLKSIPSNHINLIYSDVLYGTGRNFGDYQDLRCDRRIIENHYTPRLIEMKRVLKENGSIYLQMDTKINHWMRIILDDIFGYENFRNEIIWSYKRWSSKVNNKFQSMHDVILFYAKSNNKINVIKEKIKTPKKYQNKKDKFGNSIRDTNGKIIYYIQDERCIDDVWVIPYLNPKSKERVDYATQKPKELIERIIKVSSNENDLVGDFYLGSGTTAVVCKELNRNFIGCDISKKAIDITNKRIQDEYEKTSLFNEPLGGVTNKTKYLDVA